MYLNKINSTQENFNEVTWMLFLKLQLFLKSIGFGQSNFVISLTLA